MRLEPTEPKTESDFFQGLRSRVSYDIFFERVEPSNECGFPDVYYVCRQSGLEGTIELKFDERKTPNLKSLMRGNQIAGLLEYSEAGGARRFALCWCNGKVYLWDTVDFRKAILGHENNWTSVTDWSDLDLGVWLLKCLERQ